MVSFDCCIIRGQCRVNSPGRVHSWVLVVSMQGNMRAWTTSLKKKKSILIDLFTWMSQRYNSCIYIYFLQLQLQPSKKVGQFFAELFLFCWQLSSLWNDKSLRCKSFFLETASAPGAVIPQSSVVRGHLLVTYRQLPPHQWPSKIWKLSPTLMNCLWLYFLLKCWAIAQHLWNIKISYNY